MRWSRSYRRGSRQQRDETTTQPIGWSRPACVSVEKSSFRLAKQHATHRFNIRGEPRLVVAETEKTAFYSFMLTRCRVNALVMKPRVCRCPAQHGRAHERGAAAAKQDWQKTKVTSPSRAPQTESQQQGSASTTMSLPVRPVLFRCQLVSVHRSALWNWRFTVISPAIRRAHRGVLVRFAASYERITIAAETDVARNRHLSPSRHQCRRPSGRMRWRSGMKFSAVNAHRRSTGRSIDVASKVVAPGIVKAFVAPRVSSACRHPVA